MGIKGIYHEIGPGDRIALSKLAVETFEQKGRPLRLAIDISIWLFQIQSGKGGTNPALRTFYYRLLRLISLSIHPLFVFDGPNKPPFKRNKRTGPNVASIPEFLAKQLLKQFGLSFHLAPGEAEAECALLQQKGIVDAVLSEDVDTLMFGSGVTLRNWSAEGTLKTKTATHVNVYDATKTKAGSGLDRPGMILVALMSGGDYIPEGIPGCGPKTACEAARAGFGDDLYAVKDSSSGIKQWKEKLVHELKTNESKFFRAKHKALVIPDDFPRKDVLRYYTDPCVSSEERLNSLRSSLKWDQELDIPALREFTMEAFKWEFISGAKHFIRNLSPALLVRELRLRANRPPCDDTFVVAQEEAKLIKTIHQKRQHVTTDNMTELRVGYRPINLVDIDLDAEEPDPELPQEGLVSEDEEMPVIGEEPSSPKKKRTPRDYDPYAVEKIWILETYVRVGVPLKIQDYEESFRNAKRYEEMKAARKAAEGTRKRTTKKADTQNGTLDKFTKITKPGISKPKARSKSPIEMMDLAGSDGAVPRATAGRKARTVSPSVEIDTEATTGQESVAQPPARSQAKAWNTSHEVGNSSRQVFRLPPSLPPSSPKEARLDVVDLSLSPNPHPQAMKKQRTLRRSQSDTAALSTAPLPRTIDDDMPTSGNAMQTPLKSTNINDLSTIRELSPFVTTTRRQRSPIRRVKSIPNPPTPLAAETFTTDTSSTKTTPKRKRKPLPVDVITLSSSPAPATPSSRQKSIKDWFSPNSKSAINNAAQAEPPSPSPRRTQRHDLQVNLARLPSPAILAPPAFRLPLTDSNGNARSKPQQIISSKEKTPPPTEAQYADNSDSDLELPPLPLPARRALHSLSTQAHMPVARDKAPPAIAAPITIPTSSPPLAPTLATEAEAMTGPVLVLPAFRKPKQVIRIRDSLFGAFVTEDVIDLDSDSGVDIRSANAGASTGIASTSSVAPATAIARAAGEVGTGIDVQDNDKKRKRPGRVKQWRVSQVEVVDLS